MSARHADWEFRSLQAMGTEIRFWIEPGAGSGAAAAFDIGARFIGDFDRRLSRFNPESELCALNADRRSTVEVSSLLAQLVASALRAAELSAGLVDPTVLPELERAGYRESMAGITPPPADAMFARAPAPRPAAADPAARWRSVEVDLDARTVTRPPGTMIDSGGSGKGLAADMLATLWRQLLPPGTAFIVDCGGDMRLGELDDSAEPYAIEVETAADDQASLVFALRGGGVATSGISKRAWRAGSGYAHHLIDPANGLPAWTGISSVTAIAGTTQLAETAAKAALLAGEESARTILQRRGGVIALPGHAPEVVGPAKVIEYA
jgi:thiamine biosynthesis lipoprotein